METIDEGMEIVSVPQSDDKGQVNFLLTVDAITLQQTLNALALCEQWLRRDAPFTHPNEKIKLLLGHVSNCKMNLSNVMNSSQEELRKKHGRAGDSTEIKGHGEVSETNEGNRG